MANLIRLGTSFPDSDVLRGRFAERYSPYSNSRYKRKVILLLDRFFYSTTYPEDLFINTDIFSTYVVKASDKNRLDLIAYKFYGDASLYWVIAKFNDIIDPFIVERGTELQIPTKTALYIFGGPLA